MMWRSHNHLYKLQRMSMKYSWKNVFLVVFRHTNKCVGKKKKIVLACFPDLQISEKIIPTTVVFLMDNKNNVRFRRNSQSYIFCILQLDFIFI